MKEFYGDLVTFSYSNGMKLYALPRPGSSLVLQCCIRTGSIHEGSYLGYGLSHFVEHLLFQGCKGYPNTEIADTVAKLGGNTNAYTTHDHTCFHITLPGKHYKTAVAMLASMMRHANLPKQKIDFERQVILREEELSQDRPSNQLFQELFLELFQVHPMRYPVIGYPELLAKVDRPMLMDYYQQRYTPGRCFWVAVGELDPEAIRSEIGEKLGDWPRGNLEEPYLPLEATPGAARFRSFRFADPLSRLALATRVPGPGHKDTAALDVLNGLLGLGEGSRLVRKLTQEKPLAISLNAFSTTMSGMGVFGFMATVDPRQLNRFRQALRKELDEVYQNGPTPAEVEREQIQQLADHLRRLRSMNDIAQDMISGVIADGTPNFSDVYRANLAKLTPSDVQRVAQLYLAENNFTTVTQLGGKATPKCSTPPASTIKEPVIERLRTGQQLVVLQDKTIPMVDFSLMLPGGAIFEKPEQAGASALLAELIATGTSELTEAQIHQQLDLYGADMSFSTGRNTFLIELNAPRQYFGKALAFFSQVLHGTLIRPEVLERERQNRLSLLESRNCDPLAVALDRADKLLFGNHPYSWGGCGVKERLEVFTVDELTKFYSSMWSSSKAVLGFAGDCTPTEARSYAKLLTSGGLWHEESPALPLMPKFKSKFMEEEIVLDRLQTFVIRALPGIDNLDPHRFMAFNILRYALNGQSSELFRSIREDHALAYNTGMTMHVGFHQGAFYLYASTTPQQAGEVDRLLVSELNRLATKGMRKEEFRAAREQMSFGYDRQMETPSGALSTAVTSLYYDQPVMLAKQHHKELYSLKLDEVNELIRHYMNSRTSVRIFAGQERIKS